MESEVAGVQAGAVYMKRKKKTQNKSIALMHLMVRKRFSPEVFSPRERLAA